MVRRHLNLRQIEAFKAVIDNGTITRAAEALNVTQPAISKFVSQLEYDTGLRLFDRVKGRLVPTAQAKRLHDQVDRIFAGVREVENAVDAILREEQGNLVIGVIAPLAGFFIRKVTTNFRAEWPSVYCSFEMLGSQRTVERLIARTLDIGLVSGAFDNPYVLFEPLMAHPLVCIMAPDHPLAAKSVIESHDLDGAAFVGFHPNTYFSSLVERSLEAFGVKPNVVMAADVAPTLCELVAAGMGVSLVHPLMASGLRDRVAVRRFEPQILDSFQLVRTADSRDAKLVEAFAQKVRTTAAEMSASVLDGKP